MQNDRGHAVELQDIDLNLLVVFNELLRQRRVSAVAETLGISQPAISNALNRLRKLMGDELFIRTSKGMVPTPFSETLAEPIAYALGAIYNSLNTTAKFDPQTSTRAFTLAMTDIGEIYFLPTLMRRLAKDAPGFIANRIGVAGMVRTIRLMERHGLGIDDVDALTGPFLGRPKTATFRTGYLRQICSARSGSLPTDPDTGPLR